MRKNRKADLLAATAEARRQKIGVPVKKFSEARKKGKDSQKEHIRIMQNWQDDNWNSLPD
jgi:hypothetical protein